MTQSLKDVLLQALLSDSAKPKEDERQLATLCGYNCMLTVNEMNQWSHYIAHSHELEQLRKIEDGIEYIKACASHPSEASNYNKDHYMRLCDSYHTTSYKLFQIAEDWYNNVRLSPKDNKVDIGF